MDEEDTGDVYGSSDFGRYLASLGVDRSADDLSSHAYEPSSASDRQDTLNVHQPESAPFSLVPSIPSVPPQSAEHGMQASRPHASTGGSVPASSDLGGVLRNTHASLAPVVPKLIWQEQFWSDFFHPAHSVSSFLPEPEFSRFDPPTQDSLAPEETSLCRPDKRAKLSASRVYEKVVLNRLVVSWRDQREADLCRAFSKWTVVFESWDASEVSIAKQVSGCVSAVSRESLLGDYLARKAPSTCLKRANSMLVLNRRAAGSSLAMPIREPELYQVLRDAKAGGASLSELRGIMEAVTFVRYTFDVEQFSACAKSRRCWGLPVQSEPNL